MKPVRPGDRGPAVEDIQRRLLALGYDLGPTGVDGVFLGMTREAVGSFQLAHGLGEDGLVGDATWSALVDATFTLGDRMLYLRLPHFHGADVRSLQEALNALGFACGLTDGIFGAFTESALREFQINSGLGVDGIVGDDTVAALVNLRHVWEGKDTRTHSAARTATARSCSALARHEVVLVVGDHIGAEIADRLLNLAFASTESARVSVAQEPVAAAAATARVVLHLVGDGTARACPGVPLVHLESADDAAMATRLAAALSSARGPRLRVTIDLSGAEESEHYVQRAAVLLLDAVCAALD